MPFGGNTAEILRRVLYQDNAAQIGRGVDRACFGQRDLDTVVNDFRDHFSFDEDLYLAALRVDFGLNICGGAKASPMGGYQRGLDGFKHNLRLELALDADVVDSHDQFVFHALCALLVLDLLALKSHYLYFYHTPAP